MKRESGKSAPHFALSLDSAPMEAHLADTLPDSGRDWQRLRWRPDKAARQCTIDQLAR